MSGKLDAIGITGGEKGKYLKLISRVTRFLSHLSIASQPLFPC